MIIDFAIDLGSLSILLPSKSCYQNQAEENRMSAVSTAVLWRENYAPLAFMIGYVSLPWDLMKRMEWWPGMLSGFHLLDPHLLSMFLKVCMTEPHPHCPFRVTFLPFLYTVVLLPISNLSVAFLSWGVKLGPRWSSKFEILVLMESSLLKASWISLWMRDIFTKNILLFLLNELKLSVIVGHSGTRL